MGDYKWRFPRLDYGQRIGSSDGGGENFRSNTIEGLVREICQNSLDAKKEGEKTVIVEFEKFEMGTDKIPGKENLLEAIDGGIDLWNEDGEESTVVELLKNYKKILEDEKITMLRISDFNTTGLTGVGDKLTTKWSSLVKGSGISNKTGASGGSFGIGKKAAFTCSRLKTIFYSTYNEDEVWAYEGTGEFPSLQIDGNETQGTVFFGDENNSAILKSFSLNDYIRTAHGTDIYVFAFQEIKEEDFLKQIIVNVIENFLLAIYNEKLVVKIGDRIVEKKSINRYIEEYIDEYKKAIDYYAVLTSDKTIEQSYEMGGYGESWKLTLKLLQDNKLSNTIYFSRANGMKIKDAPFKQFKPFSGILEITGKEASEVFRAMEDVTHKNWKPGLVRINKKITYKLAKDMHDELQDFIKGFLKELNPIDESMEMDVYGLGAFFPDELSSELEDREKKEAITDKIKTEIEVKTRKSKLADRIHKTDGEEIEAQIIPNGNDDINPSNTESENKKDSTGRKKTETSTIEKGDEKAFEKKIILLEKLRVIMSDSPNKYNLIIKTKEDAKKTNIVICAKGESGSEKINIRKASLKKYTWLKSTKKLDIIENTIILKDVKAEETYVVEFEIETNIRCCMEVEMYETR